MCTAPPPVVRERPGQRVEVVAHLVALCIGLREAKWNVINAAVTQGSNKARQAGRWEELAACCDCIGFGLSGGIPALPYLGVTVLIFACEIRLSRWWLERHRFGPLEWLWRTLTYWRLPVPGPA